LNIKELEILSQLQIFQRNMEIILFRRFFFFKNNSKIFSTQ